MGTGSMSLKDRVPCSDVVLLVQVDELRPQLGGGDAWSTLLAPDPAIGRELLDDVVGVALGDLLEDGRGVQAEHRLVERHTALAPEHALDPDTGRQVEAKPAAGIAGGAQSQLPVHDRGKRGLPDQCCVPVQSAA